MKIILVEFPWQAEKISEDKYFKNFTIVSTDPEASYILKKNNCHYFETHEFCDDENLWKKYKHITENSLKIVKILDKYLWKFDSRFKDLHWNLFDDFHLLIKISYDQLYYYDELIYQLIERFNPSQIIVADTEDIKLNKILLIDSDISLFKFLFHNLNTNEKKIEIKYMRPDSKNINSQFKNNFSKKFLNKELIKEKMKNFYYKLNFYVNYFLTKPQYFSVGGYEINKFKKLYPHESKKYIYYNHGNINYGNSSHKWKYFNAFRMELNNVTEFKTLVDYKKTSFDNLLFKIILQLSKNFNNFIKEYDKAKKIIYKIKPQSLIFETMTPFNSSNVIFKKVCKDLKLPYVTWAHGGHNHYSLHGWDVSDYRLCQNHISYGIHLKEILKDEKSILNHLNLQNNLKIYPIGSTRFDYYIKERKLNKNLKKNNKFTIMFTIGCLEIRNQFYFGLNRKKSFSMQWELHYQIIKLLKKYQYKYNIIIKDYPVGYPIGRSLWKTVLRDLNANNMTLISNQFLRTDLLKISDLNLFSTLSTTFFESLYFDADIFFISGEHEIDLNLHKNKLKNELFYFSNITEYIKELEKYLDQGIFYKRKKENSRDYFINYKHFAKRDKLLSQALSQITKEKKE